MAEDQAEIWVPESALDILIALLYSKGSEGVISEPIDGITRLDKIMFLLNESKEFKDYISRGYKFEADNFGPFAPELFDDIAALKQENIISVVSSRTPKDRIETVDQKIADDEIEEGKKSWKEYTIDRYQLTEEGLIIGKYIFNGLSIQEREKLEEIKKIFNKMDLTNLLHYVYTRYPETTKKSKIKEKILDRR